MFSYVGTEIRNSVDFAPHLWGRDTTTFYHAYEEATVLRPLWRNSLNRLKGRFAAQQIPGGREYQEDDYGLIERGDPHTDGGEVLLLADGMGGHVSGDTASRMVVKTFAETYHDTEGPIPDRLRACLTAANDALADATDEKPELTGMGSTVVAAVISQHGLDWISVGDSPYGYSVTAHCTASMPITPWHPYLQTWWQSGA